MNRHNSEKYTKIKKSHYMNSVFVQPGVYSCAIDCFLEVSTYLFLSVLSNLSARSQFPELLFAAASDYQIRVEIQAFWLVYENLFGLI